MPNKKAKGKRAKTRDKFKSKRKITVNKLLQQIPIGSKVDIRIESSVHSGIPDKKFHGFTGEVIGKQGRAYLVELKKQHAKLVIGAAHLDVSKAVEKQEEKVAA
ncbi:MAG: 50S ribosomal protein L21e [Candidatus Diapherotrites archaeon]|uniref:50S ribosomal protein L21e n=1 Tax=Candidatus Iainarchaeum sp. TaxID=3101447 RepID=A0A2D6LPT1_9ARCH|nr:50S ribosomal protein L21e [Candidatus Diapherotrites archaeon]